MSLTIIKKSRYISDKTKPKTRTELEERLREDGMSIMNDEEYDKRKWLEKKVGLRK